jgi:enamine deaminase RidA (YjgF/YER057c/UK114 family)
MALTLLSNTRYLFSIRKRRSLKLKEPPARACVEVARLPKDANVEIEAVGML